MSTTDITPIIPCKRLRSGKPSIRSGFVLQFALNLDVTASIVAPLNVFLEHRLELNLPCLTVFV